MFARSQFPSLVNHPSIAQLLKETGENIDSHLFLSAMEEVIEERANQRSVATYFGKNSAIYQRK